MISSKDRSKYFGASDTPYIVGNINTKSFEKWWLTKVGIYQSNFENDAMSAGTHFEHKILDSLGFPIEKDKQIIIEPLRLRINLDGNTTDTIYEVKTYNFLKGFHVPLKYKQQVWVQVYGSKIKTAYIVAYGLIDADYKNYFNPIDKDRLQIIEIPYNEQFINDVYLPRLKYFSCCLINGTFPQGSESERCFTSLNKALEYKKVINV